MDEVLQYIVRLARFKTIPQPALGELQSELGGMAADLLNAFVAKSFDFGADVVMDVLDLSFGIAPDQAMFALELARRLLAKLSYFVGESGHFPVDFRVPEFGLYLETRGVLDGLLNFG